MKQNQLSLLMDQFIALNDPGISGIASLSDQLSIKLKGGTRSTNNGCHDCSNETCTNEGCKNTTNESCTNNNCTNTSCG